LTTSTLVAFQEDIQQFIPQAKTNLKGEYLVAPLTIIPNDNVQWSVKHKLHLVKSKSIALIWPSSSSNIQL
jgi:hypothetical protein